MMKSMNRGGGVALALAVFLATGSPVVGQSRPEPDAVADLLRSRGETYHRASDEEQDPAEVRTTQALNDEIASRNELAASQERADREAFEEAQARYDQALAAAEADRLRYEADLRAAEDAQLRYDRAMADWQATVRACQTGDRARCIAGSPPPQRSPY